MPVIQQLDNTKKELLGAVIGLARSTEGNMNLPTQSTHETLLHAMQLLLPNTKKSNLDISILIATLHEEKKKLIPSCFACASPCGKNNDYFFDDQQEPMTDQVYLKYSLFSSLLMIGCYLNTIPVSSLSSERAMEFLYKGFFYLGYDCEVNQLTPIFIELGEIHQQLFQEFH